MSTRPIQLLLLAYGIALASVSAAPFSPADLQFFEKKVRPVLAENCYLCHGERKAESGLRLHSRDLVLRGSDFQKVVVPGKPEASPLLDAVRHAGEAKPMPEDEPKLNDADIDALAEWVRRGLPWPEEEAPLAPGQKEEQAKGHWAFQTIVDPTSQTDLGGAHPIDYLVAQKRDPTGIPANPRATPDTLLRRLSYNLHGLPVTPELREKAMRGSSLDLPQAIDHLLSQPQYGERWGRHWLDVARYADTFGYTNNGKDNSYPYAFTYRDWVVDALNRDLPYDEFLRLQIAADHYREDKAHPDLAALGFLTVGRQFLNQRPDQIDDQIDTLSRGLLGLTVSCARCHDHKYDHIPTRDYYALYGVFDSTLQPKEFPVIGQATDQEAAKAFRERLATIEGQIHALREKVHQHVHDPGPLGSYLLIAHDHPNTGPAFLSAINKKKLSDGVGKGWQRYLKAHAKNPFLADWKRLMALPQDTPPGRFHAELDKLAQEKPLPPHAQKIRDALLAALPHTREEAADALADHLRSPGGKDLLNASPLAVPVGEVDSLMTRAERTKRDKHRSDIQKLEATSEGAPPRAMAVHDHPKPKDAPVRIRGGSRLGDTVPRAFLTLFGKTPLDQGSGRRQLAEAITDPNGPLAARVIANRVWGWHFGTPLVSTPSDFGHQCDAPLQLPLLDHLAAYLMEKGWSLKALHRHILTSATFAQSSAPNPVAVEKDPASSLLWRMPPRRMDYEGMRDSILATSGALQPKVGGRPVELDQPASDARRSLYARIDRHLPHSQFPTFDFPNPDLHNPQRAETAVPQQGLFLLNSPFVQRQAAKIAAPFRHTPPHSQQGLTTLYQHVLQRPPTDTEAAEAKAFLKAGVIQPDNHTPGDWEYLWAPAKIDDQGQLQLGETKPMPHFHAAHASWQMSPTIPDPQFGYLSTSATSGHPGNQGQTPVRRLKFSKAQTIDITGSIELPDKQGDGVIAAILHPRHGTLRQVHVHATDHAPLVVTGVEAQPGDHLDFVVHHAGNPSHDHFHWTPVVTATPQAPATGNTNPSAHFFNTAAKIHLGQGGPGSWNYLSAKTARDGQGKISTSGEEALRHLIDESSVLTPRPTFPAKDGQLGHLNFHATGGHPGEPGHAAVRRWTSPIEGKVHLRGEIARPSLDGPDGIELAVLHSRLGNLHQHVIGPAGKHTLDLVVEVKKGDHIDLVVDPIASANSDSFRFDPAVHRLGEAKPLTIASREFETHLDILRGKQHPGNWQYLRTQASGGKALAQALKNTLPVEHFQAGKPGQSATLRPTENPEAPGLHFTRDGGHPGAPGSFGVRRYIATRDGELHIAGAVQRPGAGGDGITATILHRQKDVVARATIGGHDTSAHDLTVPRLQVKAGDTIDFIVHPRGDGTHDLYTWAPKLAYYQPEAKKPPTLADAQLDFAGADGIPLIHEAPRYPWDALAQVLLISNEFQFID